MSILVVKAEADSSTTESTDSDSTICYESDSDGQPYFLTDSSSDSDDNINQ